MLRILLIVVAVILVGVIALGVWFSRGLDISAYEHLKDPAISNMPDQKMLVVEAVGDPNLMGQDAFELLYKAYFMLKNAPKQVLPPRARWPFNLEEIPPSEWRGLYALPVPDSVTELPADLDAPQGFNVKLETWQYGEVAEILHYGGYDQEQPTIERLKNFIASQGYEVIGDHEEVYLRGPELLANDPKDYITLIRYRVKKTES